MWPWQVVRPWRRHRGVDPGRVGGRGLLVGNANDIERSAAAGAEVPLGMIDLAAGWALHMRAHFLGGSGACPGTVLRTSHWTLVRCR